MQRLEVSGAVVRRQMVNNIYIYITIAQQPAVG